MAKNLTKPRWIHTSDGTHAELVTGPNAGLVLSLINPSNQYVTGLRPRPTDSSTAAATFTIADKHGPTFSSPVTR